MQAEYHTVSAPVTLIVRAIASQPARTLSR